LPDYNGIKCFSDQAANRADANVPGNVALALGNERASRPSRRGICLPA